ncbi:GH32 C-terminal domain-containing protein [Virgibacillus halophilus]|uniref:GH32 C-terminal domain-containing protein n=1 Tax=Tigheibacillus halophilus TaxID=361280 RepID=A0ABU5C4V1_9BACI|nr:GH32 C-terminal domain-containing protein [Virgibacillus halophilus]
MIKKGIFQTEGFTELDSGFDFYAPQTMTDENGRRILFAWMGITDASEQNHPTIANGWIHAMTIPRELSLKGDKIIQRPAVELKKLRKSHTAYTNVFIQDTVELPQVSGKSLELLMEEIDTSEAADFTISFGGSASLSYEVNRQRLVFRRVSLLDQSWEQRVCEVDELEKLHIFMDTSSLEIFVNDGGDRFHFQIFSET